MYCKRVLPLINRHLRSYPGLVLMQDNASAHTAKATQIELEKRGIFTVRWPPYSPDLNPIETV